MKRPWGLYFFSAGLILLFVQFLVILFGYFNNDYNVVGMRYAELETVTFLDTIKDIWSGIAGILLLIVLYIRRFLKGPDTLLMLVGIMLWVIQILTLRGESTEIIPLFVKYVIGFAGILFIIIATLIDAYMMKNGTDKENENKR